MAPVRALASAVEPAALRRAWVAGGLAGGFAVLAALVVYAPVRHVFFFADDLHAMCLMASDGFATFVLEPFGGHLLYARNLLFWLQFRAFGFNPAPFQWGVLLVHAVNVLLLYATLRIWTTSRTLASCAAITWGTSPLLRGTLGWYAASGQALATTALLVVLLAEARRAEFGMRLTMRSSVAWVAALLLGATSFGTGLAIAVAFPLVALVLVEPRRWARGAWALLLLLPLVLFPLQQAAPWLHQALTGASPRVHSRVTQLAGIAAEPGLAAIVLRHFADMVAHAVEWLLRGWVAPHGDDAGGEWATGTVLSLGAGAVVVAVCCGDTMVRRRLLAALVLGSAIYGLIAFARAPLLVAFGVTPAEMARTDRFHYAGSLALTLALALVVSSVAPLRRRLRMPVAALFVGWVALSAYGWATSDFAIDLRDGVRTSFAAALATIDAEIDARPEGTPVVLLNGDPGGGYFRGPVLPYETLPGMAGLTMARYGSDRVRGRLVRFVERDPARLAAIRTLYHGLLQRMVVARDELGDLPAP